MSLRLPRPTGLDPRTQVAFDDLIAAIQMHLGKATASQVITGAFSAVQPRCHLVKTAAQAIANTTATDVTWPVVGQENPDGALLETQYDNGARFGGTFLKLADSAALVPPMAGFYLVIATVIWEANATGSRRVTIRSDFAATAVTLGTATVQQPAGHSASVTTIQQVSAVIKVRDVAQTGLRDAIYIQVTQTSGGNLNVNADSHVQLIKVS